MGCQFPHQIRIRFIDDDLQKMIQLALDKHNKYNNLKVINSFTYVEYVNGGNITTHKDKYDDLSIKYTMILYLNDDYHYGTTYIIDNDKTVHNY